MSFTTEVKRELGSLKIKNKCCRYAFFFGILTSAKISGNRISLTLSDGETARNCEELIKKLLRAEVVKNEINRGFCSLTTLTFSSEKALELLHDFADESRHEDVLSSLFECEGCHGAFIRGVFCASGSVSDPKKTYSLELLLPDDGRAALVRTVLRECGLEAGVTARKQGKGLFFRNESSVEDMLTLCGAGRTALDIYNYRIEREIRNQENRATNCVAVNIKRTVNACARQITAIEKLIYSGHFEELPEEVRQTAVLRAENPEMSLSELAELHTPPISKSGLNHRLGKIVAEAERHGLIKQ